MEPLRPEDRARILTQNPRAGPGEIDEYERLLSRRFTIDPDAPGSTSAAEEIEARLAELHRRLFPQAHYAFSR